MDQFVLYVVCLPVFVNCLVKQFAICFCWMLWKFIVAVEVLCWIDRVWSSRECACCACDPSVHLSVPSIYFVFVCWKLSPSLRAGSRVFSLLMLFLILHTMWSGKSLQLLCILPFGMLGLSAISMMLVKKLAVCMLVGMVVWAKADLCLSWIVSSQLSCGWWKSVGFVVVCSHVVC